MITIKLIEDDSEIEYKLPSKMKVCSRCEGYGSHLTPSIGQHAYSREEFEESFYDPEDQEQYFKRGGIYDVPCEVCHGNNVISIPNEDACDREQFVILQKYLLQESERKHMEEQDRLVMRMEQGYYEG
jgi:hypothetical protein